jgi:hypothetical protein
MKKILAMLLLAVLLTAIVPALVRAQTSATSPSADASAPSAPAPPAPARTGPRLLTPAEQRDAANASTAPNLQPERRVIPQISVPLGRAASAPRISRPARRAAAAPPAPIGDAAARCESMTDDLERASCRKRLTATKKTLP